MTQERVASRPTGTVAFPISLANDGASIHTQKNYKKIDKNTKQNQQTAHQICQNHN